MPAGRPEFRLAAQSGRHAVRGAPGPRRGASTVRARRGDTRNPLIQRRRSLARAINSPTTIPHPIPTLNQGESMPEQGILPRVLVCSPLNLLAQVFPPRRPGPPNPVRLACHSHSRRPPPRFLVPARPKRPHEVLRPSANALTPQCPGRSPSWLPPPSMGVNGVRFFRSVSRRIGPSGGPPGTFLLQRPSEVSDPGPSLPHQNACG